MADFLSEKRAEIDRRLEELRPQHEEYLMLERAKAALDGLDGPQRRPGRPRGARPAAAAAPADGRRRGRRRGGGRAAEALELVRQNPGITVADLAERLGMSQRNYLYRVMGELQNAGAVRKEGRGFVAS